MKLRSHEEIQEFLTRPKHLAIIRKAALAPYTRGVRKKETNKLLSQVTRLLLKSALGEKVFRGSTGRAFKAVAEGKVQLNIPASLRAKMKIKARSEYNIKGNRRVEILNDLETVVTHLQFPIWSLEPERLKGMTHIEQETAIHHLKGALAYIRNTAKFALRPKSSLAFRTR